ncbi:MULTISPECIES: hypothetical protein [unclassified Mesorhizobium]|uniref:hypothetical protein n=1 Tax=unclassified Mesorhizobium TaxID=325217 RepID=UPI0011271BAA|nr:MULTISPECIES: hypothetical protein [unclassified Mesorhizobium]MCA0026631.1 hypothetical protein [Mesorhizobium sp. B263B1A]TPJ53260.1 hypothetical protein FJ426_12615 [Mesorhizobium sp. B2-6-4]TPJ90169.1 hypothetical protein FJ489_27780 [Mesorhizobium sp. B2-5-12]TPK21788.1 hypothetical protein FJ562_24470 [Mesorhizobium sp. B2-5-6]TPM97182.1 hypothetical protein FJ966_14275 [Mesorhizobium sp. B2-1-5]
MRSEADIFLQAGTRKPTRIDVSLVPKNPGDVLNCSTMSLEAKRGLLASWASDAHAVDDAPSLRRLDDGSVMNVDEILRALKALDEREQGHPPHRAASRSQRRSFGRFRRGSWSRWIAGIRGEDDDDDPPPSPVCAAIPPRAGGGGAFSLPEPEAA